MFVMARGTGESMVLAAGGSIVTGGDLLLLGGLLYVAQGSDVVGRDLLLMERSITACCWKI